MTGPARVLIVEDTPHNLDLMRYLLVARGHRTVEAATGAGGIEAALRDPPDLVVLDLQLPDMDGFQVLRALRGQPELTDVPVVAVTAFAMVGDRDKVLASGFNGYIAKPIEPETFAAEVERYVPGSGQAPPEAAVATGAGRTAGLPDASSGDRPWPKVGHRSPGEAGRAGTVLSVDNVETNLHLTRSILEPFGYEVVFAHGVSEALRWMRERVPDVVLCDIHMPGGDGFELLEAMRSDPRMNSIPLVFLSATADIQETVRSRDMGAELMVRPLDPTTLLRRVEALVGRPGAPAPAQPPGRLQAEAGRRWEADDDPGR